MPEGAGEEKAQANAPTVFISYTSQDATLANVVVAVAVCGLSTCWQGARTGFLQAPTDNCPAH
jgi:hypothetical protein